MTTFLLLATSVMSIATSPIVAAEARPAAPFASSTAAADTGPAANQAAPRYCIIERVTGSYIPHKICKTRAAWIADDEFDPLAKQR